MVLVDALVEIERVAERVVPELRGVAAASELGDQLLFDLRQVLGSGLEPNAGRFDGLLVGFQVLARVCAEAT